MIRYITPVIFLFFTSCSMISDVSYLKKISYENAVKNAEIKLADGTVLRANVALPVGKGPWPVILNAIPYHKDDMGAGLTMLDGYFFTKAGYAVVVADLRGTGASDGTAKHPLEMMNPADVAAMVEWAAKQSWSNGKVGLTGASYGGISALHGAVSNPPHLKALYPLISPNRLYENACFPGGSQNMLGLQGAWIIFMNILNLLPPLEAAGLPGWEEIWKQRIENYSPFSFIASEHMLYDDFWKKYEVDVSKVKVPTLLLDGWYGFTHKDSIDSYNALKVPAKMILGPWVHITPALPGHSPIDYYGEAIRFFDTYMKDTENGFAKEPPLSIYVAGGNFWKYENEWPPKRGEDTTLFLTADRALAGEKTESAAELSYQTDSTVGTASGLMAVYAFGDDYPRDQAADDARSLYFDTPVLLSDVEIAGSPAAELTISTDMPDAAITVRLCDVAPDGSSAFITRGWLRISRRDSLSRISPVTKNVPYRITVPCLPIDYFIAKGHRLRFNIQLGDFPRIFPLPYNGGIKLHFGKNIVQKLSYKKLDGTRPFGEPDYKPFSFSLSKLTGLMMSKPVWEVKRDEKTDVVSVLFKKETKLPFFHLEKPLIIRIESLSSLKKDNPSSANVIGRSESEFTIKGSRYHILTEQITGMSGISVSYTIKKDGIVIQQKSLKKEIKLN